MQTGASGFLDFGQNLCSAADLGPPPAHTDEKKTPVVEELWGFAFEGVTDKLQEPSKTEECDRYPPQAVADESRDKHG